jgi:hypothetical protein
MKTNASSPRPSSWAISVMFASHDHLRAAIEYLEGVGVLVLAGDCDQNTPLLQVEERPLKRDERGAGILGANMNGFPAIFADHAAPHRVVEIHHDALAADASDQGQRLRVRAREPRQVLRRERSTREELEAGIFPAELSGARDMRRQIEHLHARHSVSDRRDPLIQLLEGLALTRPELAVGSACRGKCRRRHGLQQEGRRRVSSERFGERRELRDGRIFCFGDLLRFPKQEIRHERRNEVLGSDGEEHHVGREGKDRAGWVQKVLSIGAEVADVRLQVYARASAFDAEIWKQELHGERPGDRDP